MRETEPLSGYCSASSAAVWPTNSATASLAQHRLAVQLHSAECNGHVDPESLQVALRQLDLVEANLKRFLDLGRSTDTIRENPVPWAM